MLLVYGSLAYQDMLSISCQASTLLLDLTKASSDGQLSNMAFIACQGAYQAMNHVRSLGMYMKVALHTNANTASQHFHRLPSTIYSEPQVGSN